MYEGLTFRPVASLDSNGGHSQYIYKAYIYIIHVFKGGTESNFTSPGGALSPRSPWLRAWLQALRNLKSYMDNKKKFLLWLRNLEVSCCAILSVALIITARSRNFFSLG